MLSGEWALDFIDQGIHVGIGGIGSSLFTIFESDGGVEHFTELGWAVCFFTEGDELG